MQENYSDDLLYRSSSSIDNLAFNHLSMNSIKRNDLSLLFFYKKISFFYYLKKTETLNNTQSDFFIMGFYDSIQWTSWIFFFKSGPIKKRAGGKLQPKQK